MKRWWAVIKTSWLNSLAFRADFVFWAMSEFVETMVMMFVWVVVMADRPPLAGFDRVDTVSYFLLVGLTSVVTQVWIGGELAQLVSTGELNDLLVKPMKPIGALVSRYWGNLLLDLGLRLIVYGAMVGVFGRYFYIPKSRVMLAMAGLALFLGVVWTYLYELVLGCVSFWMTRAAGVRAFSGMLRRVLGGAYAPLVFFPGWLQGVAEWLPFAYQRYFAIMIYLEKMSVEEIVWGFVVQMGWVVLFGMCFLVMWKRGLKRYEGVGI